MKAPPAPPKDVLSPEDYVGALKLNGQTFPVTLNAHAEADARLILSPAAVGRELYLAIVKTSGKVGGAEAQYEFKGVSASGKTLVSSHVGARGHQHNGDGFEVQFSCARASVTIEAEEPSAFPILTRWMRGFQSFAGAETVTPLGPVVAFGAAEAVDRDALSGGVQVPASMPARNLR